jgi:hypothetical protein
MIACDAPVEKEIVVYKGKANLRICVNPVCAGTSFDIRRKEIAAFDYHITNICIKFDL